MPECEALHGSPAVLENRNGYLTCWKALAATPIESPGRTCKQRGRSTLMSLPDDVLTIILGLLDWHRRVNMASLCRRLQKLVNGGPWLQSTRFTLNDPQIVFTAVMHLFRSEAITELDISYYVLACAGTLAQGIKRCENLAVLRCVHTRLDPTLVILLLQRHLRRLECLYWSILDDNMMPDRLAPAKYEWPHNTCECSGIPATLRLMYVELAARPTCTAFLEIMVYHCHHLRSLHLHSLDTGGTNPELAYRILSRFRSGTGDNFDDFTFTSDEAMLPTYPVEPSEDISVDFGRRVQVYKQASLRWGPPRSQNCATLAELESMPEIKHHRQLTVLIAESGEGLISRLKKASDNWTYRHLEALKLMSLPHCESLFRCKKNIRNQAALCNFIRSCVALTELNLSVFHFSEDFDCCSVVATGGLDNLRSLALPSCALCSPRRLELLSRASFKLRELDVRALDPVGYRTSPCDVCQLHTTCDDVSLAGLRCLRHLTCLTLCDLLHARTLAFLIGCASLRDLRLKNMGIWHPNRRQDMSPVAYIWPQLRSLKLESQWSAIDFSFMNNLPVAPMLTRMCLYSAFLGEPADPPPDRLLRRICPATGVIHFHQWFAQLNCARDRFLPSIAIERADELKTSASYDLSYAKSIDYGWLCLCNNYIGAIKPYGLK